MHRILSIGVLSLGKVMGIVGLFFGLLIGIPYGLILMLVGVASGASGRDGPSAGLAAFGILGGLVVMVLAPLMYGAFMFVGGLIYALVLNVAFKLAGGLELEIR